MPTTDVPARDDPARDKPAQGELARRERQTLLEMVAETAFGFDGLRPGQLEAASGSLAGQDVLAVMPTGSGKSAIYQLAGALSSGLVVVVSPLLALQRDQIASLDGRLGGARPLNSTLSTTAHRKTLDAAAAGEIRFLLMAPEQLANGETLERLGRIGVALLVIDEAHCIASWGHDFRPEYLMLGERRTALGNPPVLALTATASPPIRTEIIEELRMVDPLVVTAGILRPNIRLDVVDTADHDTAADLVVHHVAELAGTGIVYSPTRAGCEALAERCNTPERPAIPYHAGLPAADRTAAERRFTSGEDLVVVATTAFGMGIDAPHVRFVVHDQVPDSLDSYYQEFGRAGRDGEPAVAVLIRTIAAASARAFQGGTTVVEQATFDRVARGIAAVDEPVSATRVREGLDLASTHLTIVVEHLSRLDAVEVEGDGTITWTGHVEPDSAAGLAYKRHEREQNLSRSTQQMLRDYLDTSGCRWRFLARYFGADSTTDCGNCDRCDDGVEAEPAPTHGLATGDQITHASFGEGRIEGVDGDRVTVLFTDAGYKTLSAAVLAEHGLLKE